MFQKTFLLACPRCRKQQKYQAKDNNLLGKRKNCVYCNFSMDARKCEVTVI